MAFTVGGIQNDERWFKKKEQKTIIKNKIVGYRSNIQAVSFLSFFFFSCLFVPLDDDDDDDENRATT